MRRDGWGRWHRGAHGAVVSVLLCALVGAPALAVSDDAEGSDVAGGDEEAQEVDPLEDAREAADEARAAVRAAARDRAAARSATRQARSAGSSVDGTVRRAEDDIVPQILAHREARERLEDARARHRALRSALKRSEAELVVAREQLVDRVVRAYKQGSLAADTMLPLMVFREAAGPGELASAMKDLEVLALSGATTVETLVDRITRLQAEILVARAERADAEEALETAGVGIEQREAAAAERRRVAEGAETRLLQAIERELAADRALEDTREVLEEALVELGTRTAEAEAEVDDEDEDEEAARADFLRGRQRAHDRQRSLDPVRRRAVDDWVCPVEDSRFVNDWAFPRTQDRRHEGTDVFAPTGTPVVAVADATVSKTNTVDRFNGRSGFGGISVTYEHDDLHYYNAHLDAIHPDVAIGVELAAGDVIGWVGRTGNARGTPPHLHIGVYVDDVAVNPYPSLAVACAD